MNDEKDEEKVIEDKINQITEKKMFYKLKRYEKSELKSLRKQLMEIKDEANIIITQPKEDDIIEEEKENAKTYIIEYIENHKIKEYEQIPQYISEKEDNSNLVKNCGKILINMK